MSDEGERIRIDKWLWAGATDSATACGLGRAVALGPPGGVHETVSDEGERIRIDKWLWAGATDSATACGLGRAVARSGRPAGCMRP